MRADRDGGDQRTPAVTPMPIYTGTRKDVVVLSADEAEDDLPAVCLCCGEPATVWKKMSFAVNEVGLYTTGRGIGALIALISFTIDVIRVASGPRLTLRAPFCAEHQDHWKVREWIVWGGVAALTLVFLLLIPIVILSSTSSGRLFHALGVLVLGGGVLTVAVVWSYLLKRTVHKVSISPDNITLGGVHDRFIDALDDQRERRMGGSAGRRGAGSPPARSAAAPAPDKRSDIGFGRQREMQAAQQRYRTVCDELAKGRPPAAVRADLIRNGVDGGEAKQILAAVLEEMPQMLRTRYESGRYLGPIVIGVGLLVGLVSCAVGLWPLGLIAVMAVCPAGIIWAVAAHRKVALARSLEDLKQRLSQEGAPVARLAVPPPVGIGHVTAVPAVPVELKGATGEREQRRALAVIAIHRRETEKTLWMGALAMTLFFLTIGLFVCGGIIVGLSPGLGRHAASDRGTPPTQEANPNDPDHNEGPPPRGWTVLFRSNDPSIWNSNSPGESFALPVRRAHSKVRYLRLKRMDTSDSLIIPITHGQLARNDRPPSEPGHWWNGTARKEWGACHLGIVQVPTVGKEERGAIGLALDERNIFTGSGFGWKIRTDDGQYFCWQGKEIQKTAFEIAVTVDPLSAEERRRFTGPEPDEGPPPRGWTVLFRSDDPSIWNTFSPGESFALPVGTAHSTVRYLRLTRVNTGEMSILPITRDHLAREPRPLPEGGHGWNGTARTEYNGLHLGIFHAPRWKWPGLPNDGISVLNDGWDGFPGSGFGHKVNVGDRQYYCWQDKAIPKTAFEIAVTAGDLTEQERRHQVK